MNPRQSDPYFLTFFQIWFAYYLMYGINFGKLGSYSEFWLSTQLPKYQSIWQSNLYFYQMLVAKLYHIKSYITCIILQSICVYYIYKKIRRNKR